MNIYDLIQITGLFGRGGGRGVVGGLLSFKISDILKKGCTHICSRENVFPELSVVNSLSVVKY